MRRKSRKSICKTQPTKAAEAWARTVEAERDAGNSVYVIGNATKW
jgi:hypothetical protein